jgi:uncharacterized protein YecE (DUF72 family)
MFCRDLAPCALHHAPAGCENYSLQSAALYPSSTPIMADIFIGTSGFSYDDWKGEFYPSNMTSKDYLTFYARHFNALELNFSYYRMPTAEQSRQMLLKSGERLEFVVKAHREMTHEISERSLKEATPSFREGISPFVNANRLGGILLQFPQSFHYDTEQRIYLKSLIECLLPNPLFVEFRQKSWLRESVYNTLREMGVGLVCVDEPALPSLIPPMAIHTADTAYIRFHGRNSKNWYGTDATARYDYIYTEEELRDWVPKIKTLSERTKKLFIFFNNHAKAQAVTNTKMLINLLE